jgi:hypothetical protein
VFDPWNGEDGAAPAAHRTIEPAPNEIRRVLYSPTNGPGRQGDGSGMAAMVVFAGDPDPRHIEHGSRRAPVGALGNPNWERTTRNVKQDFGVAIAAVGASQPARQPGQGETPPTRADQGLQVQRALVATRFNLHDPAMVAAPAPHSDTPFSRVGIPQGFDFRHCCSAPFGKEQKRNKNLQQSP